MRLSRVLAGSLVGVHSACANPGHFARPSLVENLKGATMHKTQLALIGVCGATSLGLSPLSAQAHRRPLAWHKLWRRSARNQSHRTLPTGGAGGDTVIAIAAV